MFSSPSKNQENQESGRMSSESQEELRTPGQEGVSGMPKPGLLAFGLLSMRANATHRRYAQYR